MDGRPDEWMDGRRDGQMDGWMMEEEEGVEFEYWVSLVGCHNDDSKFL